VEGISQHDEEPEEANGQTQRRQLSGLAMVLELTPDAK